MTAILDKFSNIFTTLKEDSDKFSNIFTTLKEDSDVLSNIWPNSTGDKLMIFFLFLLEKRSWHFM